MRTGDPTALVRALIQPSPAAFEVIEEAPAEPAEATSAPTTLPVPEIPAIEIDIPPAPAERADEGTETVRLGAVNFSAAPVPPASFGEYDHLPRGERPTKPQQRAVTGEDVARAEQDDQAQRPAARRAQAPLYGGRARAPAPTPLEGLPRTPPSNATAWTSFPSPRPAPLLQRPPISEPPIPREDIDSSPGASILASIDVTSGPVPSVIVDVGAEYASLIQRVIDGAHGSQEAFSELVRHGEHALPGLMAKFPGPLRVDRHRARDQLPAASQCGAILELLVAIRRPALPFISGRASSGDPEIRFWATHVLGELRYPEAATVLVPRLFDEDAGVRKIARRSAAALVGAGSVSYEGGGTAPGAPILQGLADITRNPDYKASHRLLAIETMGEIRTGAMVLPLVAALSDRADEVAEAAHRALLMITRQDFGREQRRWGDWWSRNAGRHRIEWLIDALMHEQPALRRAAGDELKLVTKEYFGYYDDLPKKERERAQGLYRSWWEREGHHRFG